MGLKTHFVIDLFYTEEEGNKVFSGTNKECVKFKNEQREFGYLIVPMTLEERKEHENLN